MAQKKVKKPKKVESYHSREDIAFIVCNFVQDYARLSYANQAKIAKELLDKYSISFWRYLLVKLKNYSDYKAPNNLTFFKSSFGKSFLQKEFISFNLQLPQLPRNQVGVERVEPIKELKRKKPKNIYQFIKYGEETEE